LSALYAASRRGTDTTCEGGFMSAVGWPWRQRCSPRL